MYLLPSATRVSAELRSGARTNVQPSTGLLRRFHACMARPRIAMSILTGLTRSYWRRCNAQISKWRARARSRGELNALSANELRDIGLSRLDAVEGGTSPSGCPEQPQSAYTQIKSTFSQANRTNMPTTFAVHGNLNSRESGRAPSLHIQGLFGSHHLLCHRRFIVSGRGHLPSTSARLNCAVHFCILI